jgi:hypothetical protein
MLDIEIENKLLKDSEREEKFLPQKRMRSLSSSSDGKKITFTFDAEEESKGPA